MNIESISHPHQEEKGDIDILNWERDFSMVETYTLLLVCAVPCMLYALQHRLLSYGGFSDSKTHAKSFSHAENEKEDKKSQVQWSLTFFLLWILWKLKN